MPRSQVAPKPTPAELELLGLLWRLGPSTVKYVHEARLLEHLNITYATVLRLLKIMHRKGLLVRDESQRAHVYGAVTPRDSLQTNFVAGINS